MPDQERAQTGRRRAAGPGLRAGLQTWLAFVFGVVFISVMLLIAVAIPNPTPTSFFVFRLVLALAAAGIAAVIPGFLHVRLSAGANAVVRAGGAIAVFLIVYLMNPAGLAAG